MNDLFAGFIIIFIAGMIQGTTSFGFSLVALPLLGIFLPLTVIVPLLVVFSILMNSMILFEVRKDINIKSISLLIISAFVGLPIGTNILMVVDDQLLKMVVGIFITILALLMFFGVKFKVKNEKLAYIPVGLCSGILNGSVSLSGPPVILFLTNLGVGKAQFRATLTAFFWILNIATIVTFAIKGVFTFEVVKLTGILVPSLVIGVLIGIRLARKIKDEQFRKMTIILIFVMGIVSIISSM